MAHSISQSTALTCPDCGQTLDAVVWLIVDAAERPDLLDNIRDGSLHDLPCPHCGHDGKADAPLLLYRPDAEPVLLFSPAQGTTEAQDREQAAGLIGQLRQALGDAWQDEWLAEGLSGAPRPMLAAALSDDPEAALRQMAEQAEQELERLRQEDPEAYRELEEAARQQAEAAQTEGDSKPILTPPEGIDPERAQALADSLAAWMQQKTLDEAETYLNEHEADLLTDEGAAVIADLVQANLNNSTITDHQKRLAQAREAGIAAMYAEIRQQKFQETIQDALQKRGPVGQAVWQFVQLENDDKSDALLNAQADLLLTLDAGRLLDQMLQAVREMGDEVLAAHWLGRRQLWQTAYQARMGQPLRSPAGEPEQQKEPRPESWTERVEQQAIQAERPNQYTIITAVNSAIGDNALVINNIGRLPLRWRRPAEGRPRLARAAVGREQELAELHERLIARQSTAVVSQGTSAALRGQPAIGKTTLAAMYVVRYGRHYPGGVLWLEVGPNRRSADDVTPILRLVSAYAYDADAQAQTMLENSVFAAEVVRALLNGHGALLVMVDDVWHQAAL